MLGQGNNFHFFIHSSTNSFSYYYFLDSMEGDTTIYAGINEEIICKIKGGDPEFTSLSVHSLQVQMALARSDMNTFGRYVTAPNKYLYAAGGSTGGACGLELLGQAIGNSTEITYLTLSNDEGVLTEEFDLKPFIMGLRNNRSIRTIKFNTFGGDMLELLCTMFSLNPNLTRIEFYDCELGGKVLALLSSAVDLKSFSIVNGVGTLHEQEVAHNDELLAGVINALNDGIESIHIKGQNMGVRSWKALAEILPKLHSLSLDHCNNGGIGILATALPDSIFLRSLNIWNTFMGKDDVGMLARALKNSNSTLEVLKLCSCNIQNEGVVAFAEALANNCILKTLDLTNEIFFGSANNVISAEGWSVLSNVLCDTSSVNNTYLSNHTLEDVGRQSSLPSDVQSYLEMNKCTNKQQVAIKKLIKIHPHRKIGVECDQYDFSLPQEIWANVLHCKYIHVP